jgi:hypothetical protein
MYHSSYSEKLNIQVYGMTESLNISCTLIDFNPDEYKGKKVLCAENEGIHSCGGNTRRYIH